MSSVGSCVFTSILMSNYGKEKARLVPGTSGWSYSFRAESTWPIPLEPRVEGNESQMTQVLEATATHGT